MVKKICVSKVALAIFFIKKYIYKFKVYVYIIRCI
ncbi:hypothetical protein CB17B2333 [Clostridium botulinum B str. Eklund 17B (NRP)]|nr:hypothetical protein CB17B2333 [Clostridium botulinum B str. Eklund 17B (NRP)]